MTVAVGIFDGSFSAANIVDGGERGYYLDFAFEIEHAEQSVGFYDNGPRLIVYFGCGRVKVNRVFEEAVYDGAADFIVVVYKILVVGKFKDFVRVAKSEGVGSVRFNGEVFADFQYLYIACQ